MFVGHEFLAFALVGWGARRAGHDARTALWLGCVAALAALLPDLDVAYAVGTYAVAVAGGTPIGWEPFWGVANGVHRVVTHPLPVGAVAALTLGTGVSLARSGRRITPVAVGLVGVAAAAASIAVLWGFWDESPIAAAVATVFLSITTVAGAVVGRRTVLTPVSSILAAAVGFLTHPFGDVFLAVPPPLLAPFGPPLLADRVVLAADQTLNLLGILFVEVATVWAGLAVAVRLWSSVSFGFRPVRLRDALGGSAAAGLAYAPAAVVLPRPTIADAHVLGFTIVPLAVAVALWAFYDASTDGRGTVSAVLIGLVNGLAAITLGAGASLLVYVPG
ncbi:MAG: metal-dependent hydrolase [Halobellus sp.]|uniref:metal-dependent hydrolase n=1 Tax=Halobellus sp. TaxID=1979212 RepID=UPI0035D475DE